MTSIRTTTPAGDPFALQRQVKSRQICACKSLINDNQQVPKGQQAIRLLASRCCRKIACASLKWPGWSSSKNL
ncbi:unnamed protein product [Lasius platythorax]|uniref:Uncharacterized protein n=1 Tax=Lasius platythorax TaxID=488582 RepID=A0AAV2NHC7_9HYME